MHMDRQIIYLPRDLIMRRYLILNTLMHADMVVHQHMKILLIRYIVPEKRLGTADNFFCLKWCMYDV
jgi:hypothetical protein